MKRFCKRYPELSFLLHTSSCDKEILLGCSPSMIDVEADILFLYKTSKDIEPFKKWLNKKDGRHLIFIEEEIKHLKYIASTEDLEQFYTDSRVHIRLLPFQGETLEQFAQGLMNDFPSSHIGFISLVEKSSLTEELEGWLYRKSVLEYSIHQEMLHQKKIFSHLIENFYRLPEASDLHLWKGKMENIPMIICGAGPSLETIADQLQSLNQKAMILAGGSAVKALNALGVSPDLCGAVDPNKEEYLHLKDHLEEMTPWIYANRLYPKVLKTFKGPLLYSSTGSGGLFEAWVEKELGISKSSIYDHLSDEAMSITTMLVAVALYLGCKQIIFAGVDLSFSEGKMYSQGVVSDEVAHQKRIFSGDKEYVIEGKKTLVKWVMERDALSCMVKNYPEVQFFDATCRGLIIEGVKPISLDKVGKGSFAIKERLDALCFETRYKTLTRNCISSVFNKTLTSLENVKVLLEKMEKINNDKDSTFILCEYDLEDEFSYNMLIKPYWLAMMKYGKPEYKALIEEVISYQEKLSLLL